MNWLPRWGRASRPIHRVLSKPQGDTRTMTGQQSKDRGARLKGSLLFFLFLMDRTMNQFNKRISHYWRLHINWSPYDWEDTLVLAVIIFSSFWCINVHQLTCVEGLVKVLPISRDFFESLYHTHRQRVCVKVSLKLWVSMPWQPLIESTVKLIAVVPFS